MPNDPIGFRKNIPARRAALIYDPNRTYKLQLFLACGERGTNSVKLSILAADKGADMKK
jgi:hypothetical protein